MPSFDFRKDQMLPVLYIVQNEVNNIKVEDVPKYFTIVFYRYSYSMELQTDGTSKINYDFLPMPVVPCASLMANETGIAPYKPYLETKFFKSYGKLYGLCI